MWHIKSNKKGSGALRQRTTPTSPCTATQKGKLFKYFIMDGDSFQGCECKFFTKGIYFMETFNEYFSSLITNCRNNALEELRSNKSYIELKKAQDDLRTKLEAAISAEAKKTLEQFLDAAVSVKAMECNKTLLCGLTFSTEIKRLYDVSTAEYKAFENEYL